jgi:hypothetical protein
MESIQQMMSTLLLGTGKTRAGVPAPGFLGRSVPIAG